MPDTFFTSPPQWTIYIVPYFFIGGIAGGLYLLAALLHWRGRVADEPVVRLAYLASAVGVVLSGLLLTFDLGRPLRFWHMLLQSERFPLPIFKPWSPMSIGAWALLAFGIFATLSTIGAWAASRPSRFSGLRFFYDGLPGRILAAVGAFFGLFIAGYTGVLLSVTNRPIWADSNFVGLLFLLSGISTAAATLILLIRWRAQSESTRSTVQWLTWFDGWLLLLELAALFAFI